MLAWLNGVVLALHQAVQIRRSGFGRKIVHLVVEEKSQLRRRDPASEAAVQGVGDGDYVAFTVGDGVVRGLGTLLRSGFAGMNLRADGGAIRIDRLADSSYIFRIEEPRNRYSDEIGIAEKLATVGEVVAHGLRQGVDRRGRAGAGFLIARLAQDAQHLQDSDAAGTRRRRGD